MHHVASGFVATAQPCGRREGNVVDTLHVFDPLTKAIGASRVDNMPSEIHYQAALVTEGGQSRTSVKLTQARAQTKFYALSSFANRSASVWCENGIRSLALNLVESTSTRV